MVEFHSVSTAHDASLIDKLILDLERMLRFATITKSIEVPADVVKEATEALSRARALEGPGCADAGAVQIGLLQAIDKLSPRIYPATSLSLEIAEAMDCVEGRVDLSERQRALRKDVRSLISLWMGLTATAMILTLSSGLLENYINQLADTAAKLTGLTHLWAGMLGACCYILRSLFSRLAAQTLVPRERETYYLRMLLGMTLAIIMPQVFGVDSAGTSLFASAGNAKFPAGFVIAFLSGYAVEPMFTALDTIVATLRDAVARPSVAAGSK